MGITEITKRKDFIKGIKKGVVIVNFTAPWCAPCKSQEPIIEELASKYHERLSVINVNIEIFRDIALEYNVSSIPTLIVLKEGDIRKVMVGVQPSYAIEAVIDEAFEGKISVLQRIKDEESLA